MKITRREFLEKAGVVVGGITIGGLAACGSKSPPQPETVVSESPAIPKRILGRTNVQVSALVLGMGPLGISMEKPVVVEKLVNEIIDMGVNYIDVAPNYGNGEEKLGPIMQARRDEIFLATKVEEESKEGALRQLKESLSKMQTDHLDLVHLHNIGGMDLKKVLGEDGALLGLKEAKKSGLIRFIGISGHERPMKFIEPLETGEIDVVMCVLNFVDKHTYDFESRVLPVAMEKNVGVVAMKVLGGAVGMKYDQPTPALMPKEHYTNAIRYSLDLPGVTTINLGMGNRDEIIQAVEAVKNYTPLAESEKVMLDQEGQKLAQEWGAHFGPVV
ncbi:aldo/keto reductase [Candidatus Poribacteria bacterium]|nr:aldo/keto reductase [Candidatus Poribacteria bacterium]